MATATVTITDGPHGVMIVVESDPAIPLADDDGESPDVDHPTFTDAMACAVYAAVCIAKSGGSFEWRTLIKEPT